MTLEIDLTEFKSIKDKSPRVLRQEMREVSFQKLRLKSQKKVRDLSYACIDKMN